MWQFPKNRFFSPFSTVYTFKNILWKFQGRISNTPRMAAFYRATARRYCPAGANSWCSYRRTEAEGMDVSKFKHDYLPLDKDVTKALEPIYTDLSSRELLERCKGGNTQNNNESYNGLLWHFAPKHLRNGLKTIELANVPAVSIFNDSFYTILKMLQVLDVIIGPIAIEYAMERDDRRINQAELRHKASSKQRRTARRKVLASQQALFEEEEGPLYGLDIAD